MSSGEAEFLNNIQNSNLNDLLDSVSMLAIELKNTKDDILLVAQHISQIKIQLSEKIINFDNFNKEEQEYLKTLILATIKELDSKDNDTYKEAIRTLLKEDLSSIANQEPIIKEQWQLSLSSLRPHSLS